MPIPAQTRTYNYLVRYAWPPGAMTPVVKNIRGAYFTEEGALTVFKDGAHHASFAVRTDLVVTIDRGSIHDDRA